MRRGYFLIAVTAFAVALPISTPVTAQTELEQLDARLPGKLVNDPSRIDWESYGSELEASAVVDENIPGGGAARRFQIKNAKEHIYTAGTNIPLTSRVKRGDDITVGFYARSIEANSNDGQGVLRVRFQKNAEPYPGFGEKTLSIGKDWEWYEVSTEVEMGLRKKDGIIAIQFGRTKQILEIGQAIVVTGASAIADASVPPPAAPKTVLPAAEAALPKPLEGAGALLNQPARRNWAMGGTAGTWKSREEPKIWLKQATRFTSKMGSGNASDLYAKIPVERALNEGDELLIAIAARTESSTMGDGGAIIGIRVQDRESSAKNFAANRFKVGPKWQLIRIKTRAPAAFGEGSAHVVLHFAGAEQAVDIGPVYVLKTN